MNLLALLFEISDKIASIEFLYLSGLISGAIILIATVINRWFGLTTLFITIAVTILSYLYSLDDDLLDNIVDEMGSAYLDHWLYSTLFTLILAITVFVCGLKLRIYLLKTLSNLD